MHRRELGLLALSTLLPSWARADEPALTLGLRLHVGVDDDGSPAADDHGLRAWVEAASAPFGESGLTFVPASVARLPAGTSVLRTIRDRHALARHFVARAINVFVVQTILDPVPSAATRRAAAAQSHSLSGRLGGAHIGVRRRTPGTFLIVKAGSSPTTLSHELGHFFGAGHHDDPDNIMSYGRDRHRFNAHQLRVFGMFGRRYVRRGQLRLAGGVH